MNIQGFIFQPSILFIIGVIIIGFSFKHKIKQDQINKKNKLNGFFEQELQASYVRKHEVPDTFFLSIDFTYFPSYPDEDLKLLYTQLMSFKARRLCDLSAYSNLELKQKFGPGTLDELIGYEHNYFEFIDISCKYGNILFEKGYNKEAERLFEYLLTLNCDLTSCYMALISLYKQANAFNKLKVLKKQLQEKVKTKSYLSKLLDEIDKITK